jgi:ribulose 1,5-bisphosphate synthetase/thiazole synthase
MNQIEIPTRTLPVIDEADICVIGGSCTGVFAAVQASRLGAKVVIIEKQNRFGGVATSSLVNVWHSLYDTLKEKQIIGGLIIEILERLKKRDAVSDYSRTGNYGIRFNSEELTIELDELVLESGISPWLHTCFSEPLIKDGKLHGVIVDSKSGRGVICAKQFIDATGDADLCWSAGVETYIPKQLQPPTTCAKYSNWSNDTIQSLIMEHRDEFNIPDGFIWGGLVPGSDVYMMAGTRVFGKNCCQARDLTFSEIEGRRQVRAIMDLVRKYTPETRLQLQALPAYIGIRETRHIKALHQTTGDELLSGKRFDDAIANGTYPVDIHHQEKPGITFMHLDGTSRYSRVGHPAEISRWRAESSDNPTFYQVPLRSIIPAGPYSNLITAGRMIDTDPKAFGAIRVMVNLNQTGEAAGTAAWLALSTNTKIQEVNPIKVRQLLASNGICII